MTAHGPSFVGRQHTARSLALAVLLECRRHEGFVGEILDRHLGQTSLSPADRRLCTQLVYGVLRRRGTLEALLQPLITRPLENVEPWLWDALCLGAFQLALLTQVPAHAALNETVELAAAFGRPGAKGFLNGVLRALARLITDRQTDTPAAYALPLEAGAYRVLAQAVLPDPRTNPLEYLAAGFALPRWLTERWASRFTREECYRLGFWFAGPAPLTLRTNVLCTDRTTLLAALSQAGIAAEPGDHPQAIRVRDAVSIRDLPGYEQGWFAVQDESAMRVASALLPQPGALVLDLCAAPGGKATHLAELMRNQGQIVACDVEEKRLRTVNELASRLGIGIIQTRLIRVGMEEKDVPPGPFDAVLVDVPCSNTGVLGRRPEVRWRLRPGELPHLAALQRRLLSLAVSRTKVGGAIVYSTCSMEPEENRQVVQAVRETIPNLHLEAEEEAVPGRPADGGYWARLRVSERS
jgi:16S rRNA (cytosine967-C5)-methyltransferase